ncbi:4'-phosphopantetheinyl transferase NpgA, partial [Aspergillus sp. HF37]
MAPDTNKPARLARWYVDTRPTTSTTSSLPLLETLQPRDQDTVRKYYHLADRHMSLASYLLKYLFVHRTCRIPWNEISISRTPAPHHRPCFVPAAAGEMDSSIEFNVSHQASLVALAGTVTPSLSLSKTTNPSPHPNMQPTPQIGIDITCVDERSRRGGKNTAPTTAAALADFIDIFAEVFSARELRAMKTLDREGFAFASEADAVKAALRLFYTFWALKEAYIKMTGEALLAPWLRELEFTDVVAPAAGPGSGSGWSAPYTGVRTWLYGREMKDVRVEVVAFEE